MTKLSVAPGLKLDPDYVGGGTFALLAKKGAGKTYTGRVLAEEFWKAKIPFVALDPMDAWWGLRSSADGEGDGIPVAIFGGPHGDAPLERTGGKLMADLVIDEGLSMILSLKDLGSRAAERQFAMDFLDRLYRRNSDLVHLLVDEADLFAPQKPQAGDQPLLGITENIVRRGRNNGIGITMITQRPAVLNKDVLTQVDGLVAMRMLGPQDRNAIDAWVGEHGDPGVAKELKQSLPELQNGECWWWIPEEGVFSRVQVRQSETFDSSPTKKRGVTRREPKGFADIDMGAVEGKMAATIERAKATDPKALQKQIRDLEKKLADRPAEQVEREVPVEVPSVPAPLRAAMEDWKDEVVQGALVDLRDSLETVNRVAGRISAATAGLPSHDAAPPRTARRSAPRRSSPVRAPARQPTRPVDADESIPPARRKILDALAFFEALGIVPARAALAPLAGSKATSGGFKNNLGSLRSAGLIDYPEPNRVALTDAGRAEAVEPEIAGTAESVQDAVMATLPPARQSILEALIDTYPNALTRDELADAVGVPVTSGGFKNNLGAMRTQEIIDYPQQGLVAAAPLLFLEDN